MTPIDQLKKKLTNIADSIRGRTGDTDKLSLDEMVEEIDYMPTGDDDNTYILVDEDGNEIPAVLTEEEVDLTATANDIREGVVAVTDDGVITGEKEIPSYHTSEGYKIITNGSKFVLTMMKNRHEYTKLQAILCPFNTNLTNSVGAEKVAIENNVYPVQSTVSESQITVVGTDRIDFGITNTSGKPYLIRYFTYKEIY